MPTANNINVFGQSAHIAEYSDSVLMVSDSLVSLPCWSFRFRGEVFCGSPQPQTSDIFFGNYGNFNAPKRVLDLETRENGFGQKTVLSKVIKFENSFDFVCDDTAIRWISEHECGSVLKGFFDNGSNGFEMENFTLEQKQTIGNLRLCTITFTSKDDVLGKTACCAPAYTDAPFVDNCPQTNVYIIATDDAEAATLGVQVGEPYRLDIDTPYGFPNHLRIREI